MVLSYPFQGTTGLAQLGCLPQRTDRASSVLLTATSRGLAHGRWLAEIP